MLNIMKYIGLTVLIESVPLKCGCKYNGPKIGNQLIIVLLNLITTQCLSQLQTLVSCNDVAVREPVSGLVCMFSISLVFTFVDLWTVNCLLIVWAA